MNNNATMFNRLVAVFLDLLAYTGYIMGLAMATMSSIEISYRLHLKANTQKELLIFAGIFVGGFFILDILFVRLLSTTPGKLVVNCDVDFHTGNTLLHNFARSLIKVLCLFTVLPGIITYCAASGNEENRTWHDMAVRSNVTNTTRSPRFLGVLIIVAGVGLFCYFIYLYHASIGLNPSLDLPEYKIFDLNNLILAGLHG